MWTGVECRSTVEGLVKYVGADPWTTRYINEQSLYEILASHFILVTVSIIL